MFYGGKFGQTLFNFFITFSFYIFTQFDILLDYFRYFFSVYQHLFIYLFIFQKYSYQEEMYFARKKYDTCVLFLNLQPLNDNNDTHGQ